MAVRLRPRPPALLEPYDLERQFHVLQALQPTPVRVPRALWLEDSGDVLGRPFFVMERVAGTVYEMEVPDAAPERIARMCVSMVEPLAAVHAVNIEAAGLNSLDDGRHHLDRELSHWAGEMRRVQRGPLPALERLLRALTDLSRKGHGDAVRRAALDSCQGHTHAAPPGLPEQCQRTRRPATPATTEWSARPTAEPPA